VSPLPGIDASDRPGHERDRSRSRVAGLALFLAVPPAVLNIPLAAFGLIRLVSELLPARPADSMKATLYARGDGLTSLAAISCVLAVGAVLVGTTALPRPGDPPSPPDRVARAAIVMGCLTLVSILVWLLVHNVPLRPR
jgi:hypothetical protein